MNYEEELNTIYKGQISIESFWNPEKLNNLVTSLSHHRPHHRHADCKVPPVIS